MECLCLIYNEEREWWKMLKAESGKIMGEFFAWNPDSCGQD